MFVQSAAFLQTQLEQILAYHGKLDEFEKRQNIHFCLTSEKMPTFDIIKSKQTIRIHYNRDPYALCNENPNLKIEILRTGDWIIREMNSSYFLGEEVRTSTLELWDILIRFEHFESGTIHEVLSHSLRNAEAVLAV